MGIFKASLHKDRNCFFKITTEHHKRMADAGVELPSVQPVVWKRPETPEKGLATAMVVTFPTIGLTAGGHVPDRPIEWLDPAPSDHAVKVGFFFTKFFSTQEAGTEVTLDPGAPTKYLAHVQLPNDETIILLASIHPFDAETFFHQFREKSVTAKPKFITEKQEFDESGHHRGIFWGDPYEEGFHEFVEVGVAVGSSNPKAAT